MKPLVCVLSLGEAPQLVGQLPALAGCFQVPAQDLLQALGLLIRVHVGCLRQRRLGGQWKLAQRLRCWGREGHSVGLVRLRAALMQAERGLRGQSVLAQRLHY